MRDSPKRCPLTPETLGTCQAFFFCHGSIIVPGRQWRTKPLASVMTAAYRIQTRTARRNKSGPVHT
jgi:hypothetical protein